MPPPAALRMDPRALAPVVANMLQAFRRAGAPLPALAGAAQVAYENRADPGNTSPPMPLT
ncbi:hypothetical protein SBV1_180056 [Verrucomicrobia bacterium]|nr:hypothetical protein SBV1_180056 [Verrucomicrobiota bacterium]